MKTASRLVLAAGLVLSGAASAKAEEVLHFGKGVPSLDQLRAAFGTSTRSVEWDSFEPGAEGTNAGAQPSAPSNQTASTAPTAPAPAPAPSGGISLPIEFALNAADVEPSFLPHIAQIAALLSENPGLRLRIVGHTDASGSAGYNADLSMRRAESVMNHLIYGHAIERDRLIAEGRGEYQPRFGDPMDPRNRRVEFLAAN